METDKKPERASATELARKLYAPECHGTMALVLIESALLKAREEGKKEGARLNPDVKATLCYEAGLEEGRAEERGRSKALIGWIEDTRHYILECDCGGSAGYRKFGSPEYRCRDCRGGDLVEAYRQSEAETKEGDNG